MKQTLTAPVPMFFLVPLLGAQERVKFPVGVSSEVRGYGHLWAAWRLKYFERQGLDVEVVDQSYLRQALKELGLR